MAFRRWLNESHSFTTFPLEVIHACVYRYTRTCYVLSCNVHSKLLFIQRDHLEMHCLPRSSLTPSTHARSLGLAPLHTESQAEVPACLASLVLYVISPSLRRRLSPFGSNPCFVAPAGMHRAQKKSVMQLVASAAPSYHVLARRYR